MPWIPILPLYLLNLICKKHSIRSPIICFHLSSNFSITVLTRLLLTLDFNDMLISFRFFCWCFKSTIRLYLATHSKWSWSPSALVHQKWFKFLSWNCKIIPFSNKIPDSMLKLGSKDSFSEKNIEDFGFTVTTNLTGRIIMKQKPPNAQVSSNLCVEISLFLLLVC